MKHTSAELGQHQRTVRLSALADAVVQAGDRWVFCETPSSIQALRTAIQALQAARKN